MDYMIRLDEEYVAKLFDLVDFENESIDDSSAVEDAIRILIEES